jgi:sec-independent protein translocase protein TatC
MKRKNKNPNQMSLSGHISELKHRIRTVLIIFIIIFIAAYINCDKLLEVMTQLGKSIGYEFVYIQPQEVMIQQIRISAVSAFIIDLPIMVYEIAAFICPVFTNRKSVIRMTVYGITSLLLFVIGAIFAYKILLPFIYKFLYDIGETNNITAQVSIKEYITLFLTLEVCIGIVAEMPLICIGLTRVGILTPARMKAIRNYVIVLIFIIAAIITPPDIVSQIMVALPMIALYQISIFVCKFIKEADKDGHDTKE